MILFLLWNAMQLFRRGIAYAAMTCDSCQAEFHPPAERLKSRQAILASEQRGVGPIPYFRLCIG
jgi:hypothetical protein